MRCINCGELLAAARLIAIPDAELCVDCQSKDDVPKVQGYMSWEHKTAPEIIIGPEAEKLRRYDRKGVHAQLPLANRENSWMQESELVREARAGVREKKLEVAIATVKVQRSRCHPDRPKVTPDGSCLECATSWYKRRLK